MIRYEIFHRARRVTEEFLASLMLFLIGLTATVIFLAYKVTRKR